MKMSATRFYRPASSGTPQEDRTAINLEKNIFVVCDGVSGPYSPSNPGIKYEGGLTGGQMVSKTICDAINGPAVDLVEILRDANVKVLTNHLGVGKNPLKDAVAGASGVACQIVDKKMKIITFGDAFALYKRKDFRFLTNFDQAAFNFEENGNTAFETCLKDAGGDKGKAWDLYFDYFSKKQFFRANRNLGHGGHAALNGNPVFMECCTTAILDLAGLDWVLLGSDGLLTAKSTDPKNVEVFAQELGKMYDDGGLPAILDWRDKEDNLPHIAGHPEASAIELKFC